jgi:hypothetical protein
MVQYLHFRILEFPLKKHWTQWEINKEHKPFTCRKPRSFWRLQIGEAETHANLLEYVVQIWEFA